MLSIITPILCTSRTDYLHERILWFIKNSFQSSEIERIVVDFASPEYLAVEYEVECKKRGIRYIALKRYGQMFSIGACRNIGVSAASQEFITFQDVDLYAPDFVYSKILSRLEKYEFHNEIESVPCLYLTEQFTSESFDKIGENQEKELFETVFKEYLLNGAGIQMYAPVTSMILIRRSYFLELGGNNLEFHGHGYEDFEFLHRAASSSKKYHKARDYYNHAFRYTSPEYEGYRSFFSLFGRELMNDKLFFIHLWHPSNPVPSYSKHNANNRKTFDKLVREFDKKKKLPPPLLPELLGDFRTLILAPHQGKTVSTIRRALPYMGDLLYALDKDFSSIEEFSSYIKNNKINRVLFFNAYANEHRLALYNYCESSLILTINFDRGALPDSWFFDPNGFNYKSLSYAEKMWNKKLSIEGFEQTSEYIQQILSGDNELEKNGERIGNYKFCVKYNLFNKKIIFVPLQRPSDSVINYFSEHAESVPKFISEIEKLSESLDKDWVILIKPHPLEPELSNIAQKDNIKVLSHNDNFKDAISVADCSIMINSGVGLYSLMYEKPTFTLGGAFYASPGLAYKCTSVSEIVGKLNNLKLYVPDHAKVIKFIHYLVNEFYSFGQTEYQEVVQSDKSSRTVATFIHFTVLRVPDFKGNLIDYNFIVRDKEYSLNSPLYDHYRSWIIKRDDIIAMKNNILKLQLENKSLKDLAQKHHVNIDVKAVESKISPVINLPDKKVSKKIFWKKERNIKKFNKFKNSPSLFFKDLWKNLKNRYK